MSDMSIKHTIRRGSSGGLSRRIEIHLDNSDYSDDESVRSSASNAIQGLSCEPNTQSSTVANHAIEKLVIENNIFLKAALQLLDQRDHAQEEHSKACSDGTTADVIMCGKLKKASSGAMSRVWKDKFVELRHGLLQYEDITAWGQKSNKKTIQLIVRQVVCKPSIKYHGHVFEIRDLDNEGKVIHHHSRKKLFMADSSDEMLRWIEAIRTAMIGSAGDFEANFDTEDSHTVRSDESSNVLEDWRPLHTAQMGASNESIDYKQTALPYIFGSARKIKKSNRPNSSFSDGAESFSNEMRRFEHIKKIIHAASSPQAYRECLLDQSLDNVITIPVAYMKKFLKESSMGNFSLRTMGSMSLQEKEKQEKLRIKQEKKEKKRQGKKIRKSVFFSSNGKGRTSGDHNMHWTLSSKPTTIETSQAWKDLFRDTISINGDLVNGGVEGPEAMIGALVRHILLQVQIMRVKWVTYQLEIAPTDTSTQNTQEALFERSRMLAATYSDLDEGQALSIARDVLLSCNRTESGGDTYYCVQSLLCNNNFSFLTPHGCDVEPIEIVVDVVESLRKRQSRSRSPGDDSSVTSVTQSPAVKESGNPVHHLSGINEDGSVRNFNKEGEEEELIALRDSTTVESSDNSCGDHDSRPPPVSQSHYPDSLLNAAAAHVKKGGRHLGDIDDYYNPAELVLQSDIPGASAIPSNMLLMREVSKRKMRLTQQPGYSSDSDVSMSEDSRDNFSEKDSEHDYIEKSKPRQTQVDAGDENLDFLNSVKTPVTPPSYHTSPARPTPVFQVNCDDDVTVAVSELTMDSVPVKPRRRKSSMSKVIMKNLGLGESVSVEEEASSPANPQKKKRNSFFSWSNSKDEHNTPDSTHEVGNQGAGSQGRASMEFSSPTPTPNKSQHTSWKSSKTNHTDEGTGSVSGEHRQHSGHRHRNMDHDDEEETAAQSMCIRLQVIVKSKYKLCNLDPQDEHEDTWANITGQFHQHFFLKSKSNGRPAVSDRFVTVKVDDPSLGY